jgi:hypothetical protein
LGIRALANRGYFADKETSGTEASRREASPVPQT